MQESEKKPLARAKTKDKLEAFQVLLRHILAVKYRTRRSAGGEFMGIHKT